MNFFSRRPRGRPSQQEIFYDSQTRRTLEPMYAYLHKNERHQDFWIDETDSNSEALAKTLALGAEIQDRIDDPDKYMYQESDNQRSAHEVAQGIWLSIDPDYYWMWVSIVDWDIFVNFLRTINEEDVSDTHVSKVLDEILSHVKVLYKNELSTTLDNHWGGGFDKLSEALDNREDIEEEYMRLWLDQSVSNRWLWDVAKAKNWWYLKAYLSSKKVLGIGANFWFANNDTTISLMFFDRRNQEWWVEGSIDEILNWADEESDKYEAIDLVKHILHLVISVVSNDRNHFYISEATKDELLGRVQEKYDSL